MEPLRGAALPEHPPDLAPEGLSPYCSSSSPVFSPEPSSRSTTFCMQVIMCSLSFRSQLPAVTPSPAPCTFSIVFSVQNSVMAQHE